MQRCTTHKWRNLETHCPVHARAELQRDYDRISYAPDGLAARAAHDAFVKKWTTLCPAVARSLEEAGLALLTFYKFPKAMWKSLRTTNALENLNREFRRRTKTQASFGTEDAALTLALWPCRLRIDPAATNRRLSVVVVVPRREVAERCVNTPVDQRVSWNGDAKTFSTGLGTDPICGSGCPNENRRPSGRTTRRLASRWRLEATRDCGAERLALSRGARHVYSVASGRTYAAAPSLVDRERTVVAVAPAEHGA